MERFAPSTPRGPGPGHREVSDADLTRIRIRPILTAVGGQVVHDSGDLTRAADFFALLRPMES
jgi:hypothetical protein